MVRVALLLLLAAAGCATVTARRPHSDGVFKGHQVFGIEWRAKLVTPSLLSWKPQEFASPAGGGGELVFVGASNGSFYGLDARRGTPRWQFKTQGVIDSQPLYVPALGLVFFGAGDGHFYALEARSGRQRWSYRAQGMVKRAPVFTAGRLYFSTDEDRVYALDAATGTWLWQYERETPDGFTIHGQAGPVVHDGRVFAGFADGYLVALDGKHGEVVWARSLAAVSPDYVDVDATPVVHRGVLYASSHSGGLYALNPKDGSVYWRFGVVGAGSVTVVGEAIYFTAPEHGLHVLDLTGRLMWRQGLGHAGTLSAPVAVAQFLVFGGSDAGLYVVERDTGELLQYFSPGQGISGQPTLHGRDLLLLSNGGYVYRMRLR